MVWTDKTNDTGDICAKNIDTGEYLVVCNAGYEQSYPAISGSKIVWQDKRNSTINKSDWDIYMYDLTEQQEHPICVRAGTNQLSPGICGNIIVWQDFKNGSSNSDIYGCDLTGNPDFSICTASGNQSYAVIDGFKVIWRNTSISDTNVYSKILPSELISPVYLGNHQNIEISGNTIVWDTLSGTNLDVIGLDLASPASPITITSDIANQSCPAINGDWVVWQQQEPNGTYGIYAKNIVSGDKYTVCSGQEHLQCNPAISGDLVVWQSGADDVGVILAAYIPPPTIPTTVTVSYPEDANVFRSGKASHIDWQTSGGAVTKVKIEVRKDAGSAWSLIAADANNTGTYIWTPAADLNSNQCQIRISAGIGQGLSDGFFTVYDCPARVTADLTGDCKVDLRDFAEFSRQWLDCGNVLICDY